MKLVQAETLVLDDVEMLITNEESGLKVVTDDFQATTPLEPMSRVHLENKMEYSGVTRSREMSVRGESWLKSSPTRTVQLLTELGDWQEKIN